MTQSRVRRLQRELNLRLMLPVLAIVALTAVLGTFAAQYLVDRVFDRWLLDTARALAEQVHSVDGRPSIELSRQSEALITYDVVDRTYFEVLQGGQHLLGQRGLPTGGERDHGYGNGGRAYDAVMEGREVRAARVAVEGRETGVVVLVAETTIKRQRARSDLLWTMAPIGALVFVAALTVGMTVRRTIGPLERIAARWNERSHVSLEPIPMDDVPRELLPFASALNDLLERVRAMLERERQFAATVAHQLRTPLTGLRLGLARAASVDDIGRMRDVLAELGHTTQRTARLVQQLLALSRLDPEHRVGLDIADVDLVALARQVGESYLDAAQARHIELELVADPGAVVVRVQPDLLSEAIGNLLDNAIRYTPTGGRVTLSIDAVAPAILVSDSGPGIPPAEHEAVFNRFVRGRDAVGDGTGLGLAIVREIALLHGASVHLEGSDAGGTAVRLRFPPRAV